MKSIVILVFGVVLSAIASAEPLRYRLSQPVPARAIQTDKGLLLQAELPASATEDDEDQTGNGEEEPQQAPGYRNRQQSPPYPPSQWKPFGQLLVLPVLTRANFESTANVESNNFSDEQTATTEEQSEDDKSSANKQQKALETEEPKSKKTSAAFKKPPLKFTGELNVETTEQSTEENDASTIETTSCTTKTAKSGNLETTSEPDSEAVDAEKENGNDANTNQFVPSQQPAPQTPQSFAPATFVVQLPDGTFQRAVYFTQPATPSPFFPAAQNTNTNGQLVQSQTQPDTYNPIASPRVVTFSSQYQAF